MSKWTFNSQEGEIWPHDLFETREEALAAGMKYAKEERLSELFIGEAVDTPIDFTFNADDVIEKVAEYIDDNYGGDWDPGQTFSSSISKEDEESLENLLNDAFEKWIEEREIKSHTFLVQNIERIELVKP